MYERMIQPSRGTPIEDGKPVFGTWMRPFDYVNLLDVNRPFRHPLIRGLRDLRIKEWQQLQIHDGRFLLTAALLNLKYYRIAQVMLWDSETRDKLIFRKALPFGAWNLPKSLSNASVTSRSLGYYFRIHSWLDADVVELDLDIEPRKKRPSFTGHVEFDLARDKTTPLVACLPFSERRCLYTYKALAPVRGDLVFGGRHINLSPESATGLFMDFKGYYPYRMRSTWASGLGFDAIGRRYGFSLAQNQILHPETDNENALWIHGRMHPLPPVRITQSSTEGSEWVIQDLEGMVDLTFSPREQVTGSYNLVLTRSEYNSPLGVFNGNLVSAEGEKISVRNLPGYCESIYLRV